MVIFTSASKISRWTELLTLLTYIYIGDKRERLHRVLVQIHKQSFAAKKGNRSGQLVVFEHFKIKIMVTAT